MAADDAHGPDGRNITRQVACWVAAVRTHYIVLLAFTLAAYLPRLCLSYGVVFVAQLLRALARLTGAATGRPVANRRILVISDYMPPQTHGIAIRCHAYVKEMRAQGHEVVLFSTAYQANKETSFDHPNIPSVVNPFNLNNRIGYTPGIKLSWYLSAHTWDVVHVVFPSLIASFVLGVCNWRRIPVYCSHHVEMQMFAHEHVPFAPVCHFGLFMYNIIAKWPASRWGTLNAAPTLVFAKDHLGTSNEERLRRVPSGSHDVFKPEHASQAERREVRLKRFGVDSDATKVIIMVQRLSGEKGTERIFPVLVRKEAGGQGVDAVLAIAGDGPAKAFLMDEASRLSIPAVFLGNVPHHELPRLYRAADCFVTMSLSETFGLTCLEAMMCGCPAVMPYCPVFDEIWDGKIPKAWRYAIHKENGVDLPGLSSAIAEAQRNGRLFLNQKPVRMTWRDAANELLRQYEECISLNADKRKKKGELVRFMDHCIRMTFCSVAAGWVLAHYYLPPLRRVSFAMGFGS